MKDLVFIRLQLLISFILVGLCSYGQSTEGSLITLNTNKGVVYNTEYGLELRVHTNGFGLGVFYGKIKTFYKTSLTYFVLSNAKDGKEIKQDRKSVNFPTTPFAYGKINSLYNLEAGKSLKYYWSDKDANKGVMVGYMLGAGVTLGIMQPYYLKVKYTNPDDNHAYIKEVKYDEKNPSEFLTEDNIIGRAGLFKGFFQSRLIPGLHGQAAIHCDFGRSDRILTALQVGTKFNLYTQPVQFMANGSSKPYLLQFYLSLQFGKRK